jgi:hypothetical protein
VHVTVEMFEDQQAICRTPAMGALSVLAPPIKLDGDGFQPAWPAGAFASETRAEREIDARGKWARRATRPPR